MANAVRIAFVGCGSIARHHLKAVQASSYQGRVCAVVDKNREVAEQFVSSTSLHNCEVFTSFSDCLQWGEFDAAVLMLPHYLHEPYATDCLRANKHVLLEKPMAHTLPSCVRIMKEAEKSDALLMIGEQSPYWPEVAKAKELIESGEIGQPYFAMANYWESGWDAFAGKMDHEMESGSTNWRFDKEKVGGGCFMDGATHWVRPLRTWFGEVAEVVGIVGYPLKQCEGESLGKALLRFSNGLTASLYCQYNDIPMHPLPFFQIYGDKGEITIDGSFAGGMGVVTKSKPEGQRFDSLGGYNAGFPPQMEVFLKAIDKGEQSLDSCRDGLGEVLVANAIYKSLRTKKWESTSLDNLLDDETR